jgi:thiol-disulfide isomerase/thioredoxin
MAQQINKHILFYSDRCPHCASLLHLIKRLGTETNYKFISVDNPQIKLPEMITEVPTLIVKGMNRPLIGKEVFTWIESLGYMNLQTNNITTVKNPNFTSKIDLSLNSHGNTIDINFISLTDNDDELNKKIVDFKKLDEIFITDDINKIIVDSKIKKDIQDKELSKLLAIRTGDLDSILSLNKQFVK